jgi:hypothetical protein
MAPKDRVRGQARSYSGFGSSPNFAFDATSVRAGLLANAVYQATVMALKDPGYQAITMALTDRIRGQARSYRELAERPVSRLTSRPIF